ncbi:hypothetical protein FHETE_1121 [Fusarium heterosporum]|uniref:Uncharacterized protein n=1 Tax=Fusarium heterosporum TaxID=42747 RepID=A0A8H5X1C3_FUSHE|nr:hypothetical protein FHETE_1121 [Fusarium heterosporum]
MDQHNVLKSLITPSLLIQLAEAYLPVSKTEPLDFSDAQSPDFGAHFADVCKSGPAKDALTALSRLSHDGSLPSNDELDLTSFLTSPASPDFPQQCYGLQLLLDQASRVLLTGIDGRWQVAYFGPLARRLAGQWFALPESQRPYKQHRWEEDVGATSFSYWVATQIMWAAPFLHAEDLDSQQIGLDLSEELRKAVEAYTGTTDPNRAIRDVILKDDLFFLREFMKGPPKEEGGSGVSMASWTFWWCMILDAHWPIIEKFGRYPYRNGHFGRDSTEAEKKWLDDVGHFGEASPEVAQRIREDVEKQQWTPLGGE